jgi:hypothetical protein
MNKYKGIIEIDCNRKDVGDVCQELGSSNVKDNCVFCSDSELKIVDLEGKVKRTFKAVKETEKKVSGKEMKEKKDKKFNPKKKTEETYKKK